ncbi:phage tail sheath family protein [Pseudanabaenaceae cyanobacterium LEGE 13415]|nr:phage tail sheath family protein [Pseudanabaenaceae cyanobacterium LEGE 13415]
MTNFLSPGVYVIEKSSGAAPISGVGTSTAGFIGVFTPVSSASAESSSDAPSATRTQGRKAQGTAPTPDSAATQTTAEQTRKSSSLAAAGEVVLCTNFSEFKAKFGDFSKNDGQRNLAHAVFGFFRNGGTLCYVVRVESNAQVDTALEAFAAIDEIAIVAAPGITEPTTVDQIIDHCEKLGDRVAILDGNSPNVSLSSSDLAADIKTFTSDDSNYAALYFPWIETFDPINNKLFVPPSGHLAGIYARVDAQRGVFKAPANEPVLGATNLQHKISKARQDILNPAGINCIRSLNGSIRVWGARTIKAEGDFTYISVRRLFNYLRESIDEGTQWAVFEPNSPDLWARIRRSITAFLTVVWRSGALFGNTPEEAFFVKCDEETNPPENRDLGQVRTVIGVAVVKPAEFVIFEISPRSGTNS